MHRINRVVLCQGQSQNQKRVGSWDLECRTLNSKCLRFLNINPSKRGYSQRTVCHGNNPEMRGRWFIGCFRISSLGWRCGSLDESICNCEDLSSNPENPCKNQMHSICNPVLLCERQRQENLWWLVSQLSWHNGKNQQRGPVWHWKVKTNAQGCPLSFTHMLWDRYTHSPAWLLPQSYMTHVHPKSWIQVCTQTHTHTTYHMVKSSFS